jgi:hypothetical protein
MLGLREVSFGRQIHTKPRIKGTSTDITPRQHCYRTGHLSAPSDKHRLDYPTAALLLLRLLKRKALQRIHERLL